MDVNSQDYFRGAMERMEDAQRLYDAARWVGAVYLAGRSVEAMLRSLLWRKGRKQEVGHDLRHSLRRTGSLGLLTAADEQRMLDALQTLAPVWHDNLRFVDDDVGRRMLGGIG